MGAAGRVAAGSVLTYWWWARRSQVANAPAWGGTNKHAEAPHATQWESRPHHRKKADAR
jgi:hypothetical protein